MKTINLCENTDFPNKIGKGTRILGIDPGKKNIGISISDPNQKIATPLKIIFMKKFKKFIEDLNRVIMDYEIKGIVVGNPINMDGSIGPRSQSAKDFAQNISKMTNLPITLWDERLSSDGAFSLMDELDINSSKKQKSLINTLLHLSFKDI